MVWKRFPLSFFLVSLATAAAVAGTAAQTRTEERLSYDVYFLASDALEGRLTGSPGARVAADFIAGRFRDLGLKPEGDGGSFFQAFSFIAGVTPGDGNRLHLDGSAARDAQLGDDFQPLPFSSSGSAAGEV